MPQSPRTASSVTQPTGGSHALASISGPRMQRTVVSLSLARPIGTLLFRHCKCIFLHGKRQALPCKYCNVDAPIAGCTAQPRNTAIISKTVATLSIFDYGQSCL